MERWKFDPAQATAGDLARVRLVHAQLIRTWLTALDEIRANLDGPAADRLHPLLNALRAKLEADQGWLDACTSAASVAFQGMTRPANDRPMHEIEADALAAVLNATDEIFGRLRVVSAQGGAQHVPQGAEVWTLAELTAFAELLGIWSSRKGRCARCGPAEANMEDESEIPF